MRPPRSCSRPFPRQAQHVCKILLPCCVPTLRQGLASPHAQPIAALCVGHVWRARKTAVELKWLIWKTGKAAVELESLIWRTRKAVVHTGIAEHGCLPLVSGCVSVISARPNERRGQTSGDHSLGHGHGLCLLPRASLQALTDWDCMLCIL